MRAYVCVAAVLLFGLAAGGFADPAQVNPDDLDHLYSMLHAPNATEMPRDLQTAEGFLRYVGAPPGGYFTVRGAGSKAAFPETAAQTFVGDHLGAFVRPSARLAFRTEKVSTGNNFAYVRLQETYNGLPVLGAHLLVQLDAYNGVVSVLSDVLRDTSAFDEGAISLTPRVAADAARQTALSWIAANYSTTISDLEATAGTRVVFAPDVVGAPGTLTVAWRFVVANTAGEAVREVMLVDGHTGQVIFHYTLIEHARNRKIYDAQRTFQFVGKMVRSEGNPLCDIVDADLAYDYFGDTYDFYNQVHGRDSIDNKGLPISGTVRLCFPGSCPYENAFYVSRSPGGDEEPGGFMTDHMYFGEGFASADDVIAHELTHGVTAYESNLIYTYQSGAMNESFSDIWGEFIDLANGRGNDTPEVRWLMGEDLPSSFGVIRSMKNPPDYDCPDRVNSPLYYKGSGDNGGVHTNSGVINKLCYLLTDGDRFNGRTIAGMGMEKTVKLFYELQTNLLTESSDFTDLYFQLGQATINLGFTLSERRNVREAALSVEIAPDTDDELIKAFRAVPTLDERGRPVIALTWLNPTSTHFRRVIIRRSQEAFPTVATDGMEIYRGAEEQFLDTAVVAGTRYFYTIFSQMTGGFPDQRQSQAVAGGLPADFLTEAFDASPAAADILKNPLDLSFTQLTYSPVGPPATDLDADVPFQGDYSGYILTVKKNVTELPVSRDAPPEEGTIDVDLSLAQNGVSPFPTFAPIPFFGISYNTVYLAGNGYVAFQDLKPESTYNTVISSASHFSVARVSFLFSDLAPTSGGQVWGRILKDRIVVTFENVPEQEALVNPPSSNPNTVQLELYYSGRIRITYLTVQAKKAVVGLSDGQGPVIDPALLFPGVQHVKVQTDLTAFPPAVSALTFEPLPPQNVTAGEEIKFVVRTAVPPGAGIPTLEAQWNGPGFAPFADSRDGTGVFDWKTSLLDAQVYTVRFIAKIGTQVAYEDVYLAVGIPEALPEALNVVLKTNNPFEDPRRDRPVDDDAQLHVSYDYWHPGLFLMPDVFGEGATQILWFKDDRLIPAFNDQRVVPPAATEANERWFYLVTPLTKSGLLYGEIEGTTRQSPTVTIASLPKVLEVTPPTGPSTGGTTIVILGERLGHPISVTFGGVEVQSITAIDDARIEVVLPAHMPSFVMGGAPVPEDVVVTTAAGAGTLAEAFTFTDSGAAISKADVNRDGAVNALDVQLVINAVLKLSKSRTDTDVNCDGAINSADIQLVINAVLAK